MLASIALAVVPTTVAIADDGDNPSSESASEPINVAYKESDFAPSVKVSYVPGWNSADALHDGITTDNVGHGEVWGTYGEFLPEHWAEYEWEDSVEIVSSNVWFWNDAPDPGNVLSPESWKLQYEDESTHEWVDIDAEYPIDQGEGQIVGPNTVTFDKVITKKLRLTLRAKPQDDSFFSVAATEWEVFGWSLADPPTEPEPENPNAPLEWEDVAVQTVMGEGLRMPDSIWGVPENGPLSYYKVEWDLSSVDANTVGQYPVVGNVPSLETKVSGTVYVVETLSQINNVDYVSTITTPGVAPVCPATVGASFEDDTRSSQVPVTWTQVSADSYAQAEQFGDIVGFVEGYESEVICTFWVVEPTDSSQLPPVVTISFNNSPAGSGWFVEAPILSIDAQERGGKVESIEFSINDGNTWNVWSEPVALEGEGEISVIARATDVNGNIGQLQEPTVIKVDTRAPETGIDYTVDKEKGIATFTLNSVDPEPGSGVSRVLFSYGTSDDPTNLEENEMWATYEDPFSVTLRDVPVYVHVHAQDAAGHQEETQTVRLDPVSPDPGPEPGPEPGPDPEPEPGPEPGAGPNPDPGDGTDIKPEPNAGGKDSQAQSDQQKDGGLAVTGGITAAVAILAGAVLLGGWTLRRWSKSHL